MLAAIRIRGTLDVNPKTKKTLQLLMLIKPHQMVLVDETKEMNGMVRQAKDYLTFGKIDELTCARVIEKRGRLAGDKRIGKEFLQKHGLKDFEALAKAVLADRKKLRDFGIKPVFRLSPPKKGFERPGIKKSFSVGGVLGNRGENINALIEKMM